MSDETEKKTRNIVDTGRYKYQRTVIQDGRRKVYTKDNGDAVAVAMRGYSTEDLVAVLDENQMNDDRYRTYAAEKSPGHFRMIVGQALRYKWKRGEEVKFQGTPIVPFAPPEAAPDAA